MKPDAARLVAAVCLAIIAFVVSGRVIPLLPEGTDIGYFTHVNVLIGILTGWIVMGKRAGVGLTGALNNGLTGVVAMTFWCLFVQGVYEMVRQAMRNRYDGPFEAIMAVFEIGLEYAYLIAIPGVIWPLLIGGLLTGLATEYAWRQWR